MTVQNQAAITIPLWAYAYDGPDSTGKIKTIPDDFVVEEQLPFEPEGAGEHSFLLIEKCGENTEYVARLLARFAGVRQRDVSYAGLKDRHARTIQWFSIWLPGKDDPDWKLAETDTIKIIKNLRHIRKLKRGILSGNDFKIRIRDWQGDKLRFENQLLQIKELGIPNYFGLQRFGYQGQNINKAIAMFQGAKVKREQRSIYLSATRSYLFNQLLAKRIEAGNWNQAVSGDCFIFDQSNSYFKTDELDDSLFQRIKAGEIHPTGLMFGKGESETTGLVHDIEKNNVDSNPLLTDGLVKYDLSQGRRSLRVCVDNLNWEFQQNSTVMISFSLPAGSYATSLLRELIIID
jgi:tRNA pseudouridine13 synthase